ncbi:MAG: acetamidase/formamidase family protein [Acidobacteriia bacterium]|nr:acetamidase/formamidase family protein [Terriglobia bacterium]
MVLAIVFLLSAMASSAAETHRLVPTPGTVTWGYFEAGKSPALKVRSGDTVQVETLAAISSPYWEAAGLPHDQVQPALLEIERERKDPWDIAHILTGPVYVEGAEPGDTLEVHMLSVELAFPYAINFFAPGGGFLSDEFPYSHYRLVPLDPGRKIAKFSDHIEIHLRPYFGVMGVAPPPELGRLGSGAPWIHGGNMDNKELVEGSTLYLPVHVKGALFSIGDGHAGQGDGEVSGTALETSLRANIQLRLHKDARLRWPRAETPTHYITMGFHENLEEAAKLALDGMLDYLEQEKHMSRAEAYVLASDAVDLHITQLVDGRKGVHAMLPKKIFVK